MELNRAIYLVRADQALSFPEAVDWTDAQIRDRAADLVGDPRCGSDESELDLAYQVAADGPVA